MVIIMARQNDRKLTYLQRGKPGITPKKIRGNPLLEGLQMTKKLKGLLKKLDNGSEDVRLRALEKLCEDKNEQVVVAGLYQALKNENFWVRHHAVKKWKECLREGIELGKTFPVIVRCIADSTELVREEAKDAVLSGMIMHREQMISALIDATEDNFIGRHIEIFIGKHCQR